MFAHHKIVVDGSLIAHYINTTAARRRSNQPERNMQALKNAAISAKIMTNVQAGMTLREAFDAVLGQGAYAKLAGDVYDALRAK